ncbi:MAG TPA: heme-binding protein [Burkholderiales bacterium]
MLLTSFALGAAAQQPLYGSPISVEDAKRVASAGMAEAKKNNFNMAVAVVDSTGHLVYFERMDTVQLGSIAIAQDKAMAAANTRRSTKSVYEELEKGGAGLRYLNLRGFVTSEGGELLMRDGKVIGAVGFSGGSGAQDGQCARAGVAALGR